MKHMLRGALLLLIIGAGQMGFAQKKAEKPQTRANPPIYIAFLWHMHQPVYRPGETVLQTDGSGRYSYSVIDIHNSRTGPYTTWPSDAINKGIAAGLPHLGASVSFSGSLIRNLNQIEAAGRGFSGWKNPWRAMANNKTTKGNYRLDMIGFGYHHPLMGLVDYDDIRHQISSHKQALQEAFGVTYSKGIFPPENAFAPHMVPALVDEGLEWVLVDNVHFERAAKNYPWNKGGSVYEPNPADQRNPDPNDWAQLNGLWAPTRVSVRWGHQPHYVAYTDPETGATKKIVAVPTSRYLGNEDGRGGFGALNYESVMSQMESYNTDPNHPILIVLHHDGDNFGGGSEGYYGGNFQNFVNWLKDNPSRFVGTTVQDYLDMFPVDQNDVIHVEDGSWAGADAGDPEFLKWLGKPGGDGYSPDRNSWAILTAAKNHLLTAQQVNPSHTGLAQAREMMSNAQASDYWYWDGTEIWDSNPARGANLALDAIDGAWNGASETVGPTIFYPQREPYNPGLKMWEIATAAEMTVWSYVYDVSGLKRVQLKFRTDNDGVHAAENNLYADAAGTSSWTAVDMTEKQEGASRTEPLPRFRANRFEHKLTGITNKMVDYYIEAEDNKGNIRRSVIKSVFIGDGSGSGGGGGGGTGSSTVSWNPKTEITKDDTVRIVLKGLKGGKLHWGINPVGATWTTPAADIRPAGSELFNGSGPAVQTPFPAMNPADSTRVLKIGPFNKSQAVTGVSFVINFEDNSWDNNGGQDYKFAVSGSTGGGGGGGSNGWTTPTVTFAANGTVDPTAKVIAQNGQMTLWADFNGRDLYVATQSASSAGQDVFLFVSTGATAAVNHPWDKAGQVSQWVAYIGNESTNNWAGWTDGTGTKSVNASSSITEGIWDISAQFATRPDSILIAAVRYGTNNKENMVLQAPNGNGDNNLTVNEYAVFKLDTPTGVRNEVSTKPAGLALSNYPNPFNPGTVVRLSLPAAGKTAVHVFDVQGRAVATLQQGFLSAGEHSWRFDASNLAAGLYLVRAITPGGIVTSKMALVK
jgi:hypothetical protein